MALPTPRQLLTSLIDTLTSYTPPNPKPATKPDLPSYETNSSDTTNPLKSLPASYRALLTTLHVIIPPPTLLQALDLLDRRLVTRISYTPSQNQNQNQIQDPNQSTNEGEILPQQAHIHLPSSPSLEGKSESHQDESTGIANRKVGKRRLKTQGFFLVKSSQISRGRFKTHDDRESSGTPYIVRLEAWNCSCAAFAFAAFPATGSWRPRDIGVNREKEKAEEEWQYGGESLDGRSGEDEGRVPVCKHLLACLLGDRWENVLGGFVDERLVSREEMAGLSAF